MITKLEALDTLDRLEFFQGQRAGRELWFEKNSQLQDIDIACFVRDISNLREYIQTAKPPRSEWISAEERLPENDCGKHWKDRKYYLVFTKPSGLMNVAVFGYKEHDWWIDRNSCVLDKKNYKEVTHWMPLPEPPRGEKHDPA
ncbi:MAG: DUF551 domain-containing protein [Oscillospiraceae bacterium]|nr:DUF551 domain-containing protein [Oscillospiraceae bacterium]